MKLIPLRTSRNLLKIIGYYAAAVIALLLLSHAIAGSGFTARSIFGLATIAIIAALVAGIGFWFNGRLFFIFFSSGLAVGLLYMLFIVVFNTSPGWSDLTSVIGFMVVAVIGMVVGLAAELIRYMLKTKAKTE
jgi:hypothetical protein